VEGQTVLRAGDCGPPRQAALTCTELVASYGSLPLPSKPLFAVVREGSTVVVEVGSVTKLTAPAWDMTIPDKVSFKTCTKEGVRNTDA
jgi:hypothetical protein